MPSRNLTSWLYLALSITFNGNAQYQHKQRHGGISQIYQAFIKQLVLARKAAGLTQMQVAEKLAKPQSYIAKVEGADRKLDVMEFVELCEAIHQDPSELIKLLKP